MNGTINNIQRNWITDILLLCLLIGTVFGFLLGDRPLNVPDEARYSEIPREMLVMHNFVTPHINGIKYFEKPPLLYWMQAGALKTFGINEWATRLVDALMALIGCLATYITTRKCFDRKTGLFATGILTSSLLYYALARVVTLDMTVSVLITLTLFAFILGVRHPPGHKRRFCFYLLYIFAALAVLAKGLIGIILPGGVVFFWMLLTNSWRELKNIYLPTGLLLFLAIAMPWHILVQQANPEFFRFYFIDQQFVRYLTKDEGRYQPIWFYIPIVILGVFPWSGFLYGALKRIQQKHVLDIFFLTWAAVIFIFFSLSDSKLVPYVLPCFPPLAILIARFFAEPESKKDLAIGFNTISIISTLIIIAILVALSPKITTNYHVAQHWSILVIFCLIINAIFAPWLYRRKGLQFAFIAQLFFSTAFLFSLCAILPYIYMDSIKPMAMQLNTVLKPGDMVATYDYYYQDLPFYLQRTVTIVNWGGELKFGQAHQNTDNYMIDDPTFWRAWQSQQVVYMMVARDLFANLQKKYPYRFYPFANGKNDLIVVNHPRNP